MNGLNGPQTKCNECGSTEFEETGFGLDTCIRCGLTRRGSISDLHQYINTDRVMFHSTYTRRKRFRKYLMRANRNQSANTVPAETWAHLLKFAPFQNPAELHRCLKAAKHLKRKCYDSMSLMCAHLCLTKPPSLSMYEISRAMVVFTKIDRALRDEPMISYLYCLEFVLKHIGRHDLVAFINCIKCPKRRHSYQERLNSIFKPQDILTCLRYGKKPRAT